MRKPLVPDEPRVSPGSPQPKGGRPPVPARACPAGSVAVPTARLPGGASREPGRGQSRRRPDTHAAFASLGRAPIGFDALTRFG